MTSNILFDWLCLETLYHWLPEAISFLLTTSCLQKPLLEISPQVFYVFAVKTFSYLKPVYQSLVPILKRSNIIIWMVIDDHFSCICWLVQEKTNLVCKQYICLDIIRPKYNILYTCYNIIYMAPLRMSSIDPGYQKAVMHVQVIVYMIYAC